MSTVRRISTILVLAACVKIAGGSSQDSSSPTTQPSRTGDIYTLETCVVTGKKLGSMGDPVIKVIDGREVRFCCAPCIPKFEADKPTYFKRIDQQLIEQQMPHYPLTVCVVMPDDSIQHPDSVPHVHGNRLVRLCCSECVKEFNDDPRPYLAKLDKAVIAQQQEAYPLETCPVGGERLGSRGQPVNYVVGTMLVRLCCAECVKSLEQDPQPVLARVRAAWAARHSEDHEQRPVAKPG